MKNILRLIMLAVCFCLIFIQPSFAKNNKKHEDKPPQVTVKKLGANPNGGNCVGYANSQVKNLPHGLNNEKDKENAINSYKPKKNTVAVIDSAHSGEVGHVAVVKSVDNKGNKKSITIQETNFGYNGVQERTITGSNMKNIQGKVGIVGYIDPNKKKKK